MSGTPDLYIVFDRGPSNEPYEEPRFVRVENDHGGQVPADHLLWERRDDGTWALGPFSPTVWNT